MWELITQASITLTLRSVRLTLARTVYLSYRIGNHIYWTRRRITLHKGEKLITDGTITARTRCANRVEETPQQEAASPVEHLRPRSSTSRFELGKAQLCKVLRRFRSNRRCSIAHKWYRAWRRSLRSSLYGDPFVGGNFIPMAPPPLPAALCAPVKKKTKEEPAAVSGGTGKKKNPNPCGAGGGGRRPGRRAPNLEPGCCLLSGLAAIYWRGRDTSFPTLKDSLVKPSELLQSRTFSTHVTRNLYSIPLASSSPV